MIEKFKNLRRRLLPGATFSEIVQNELKDIFLSADFRPQFWLMAGYSALLMAVVLYAESKNHFSFGEDKIIGSFLALALYFIFSDFLKRKKILAAKRQFLLDAFFYVLLMLQVIIATGGQYSPITFSLLFLTAVSAPLYGSFVETALFTTFIVIAYAVLAVLQYGATSTAAYFKTMEGLALLVAALSVKISLSAFQKKVSEYEILDQKRLALAKELDEQNRKLEIIVKDKTRELSVALKNAKSHEGELDRQKKAILNILEDIAEEKKLSMLEQEKLSRILQSIGDAVYVVDENQKIIIFNRVAEELTGYLAGEAVGRRSDEVLKMVFERDRTPNNIIQKALESGKVQEITSHTLLINKNGKEMPIADSAAPIRDREGKIFGCIVVFRDVTREREIDRQKTEFVSVASHQLRTPLTSIKWFLEMMLDGDTGKLTDEQKDTLTQVFKSNERMIDLVNKLLNVSRIESGRAKVDPQPTNLNDLIKSVANEITPLVKQKNQRLEVEAAALPILNVDSKLVRQVIANYLSNAIKYTPAGGRVRLSAKVKGAEVVFGVKDSGIGIPANQLNKVFHKFFRADNAVAMETEGTGMGLYVCKSIIGLSGGRTWFESREGKGSTFYFSLPLSGSKPNEGDRELI